MAGFQLVSRFPPLSSTIRLGVRRKYTIASSNSAFIGGLPDYCPDDLCVRYRILCKLGFTRWQVRTLTSIVNERANYVGEGTHTVDSKVESGQGDVGKCYCFQMDSATTPAPARSLFTLMSPRVSS